MEAFLQGESVKSVGVAAMLLALTRTLKDEETAKRALTEGRIGLTGPEVIEQEMGKDEFDASNKALVYRTTGAKHKYIIQDI
jgi:hypothetical protein